MPSPKRKIGDIGENKVVKHLVKHRFRILDRNYLKKWGELDIIAKKRGIIHFFEVKSVSHETGSLPEWSKDGYGPEDNIHPWKLKRLSRTIQSYLAERNIDEDTDWQLDIATVLLDFSLKRAKIKVIWDVDII